MIRFDNPTYAEVSLSNDLAAVIRDVISLTNRAVDMQLQHAVEVLESIRRVLGRVADRFEAEGADYFDEAEAFARAGRVCIADWTAHLDEQSADSEARA